MRLASRRSSANYWLRATLRAVALRAAASLSAYANGFVTHLRAFRQHPLDELYYLWDLAHIAIDTFEEKLARSQGTLFVFVWVVLYTIYIVSQPYSLSGLIPGLLMSGLVSAVGARAILSCLSLVPFGMRILLVGIVLWLLWQAWSLAF